MGCLQFTLSLCLFLLETSFWKGRYTEVWRANQIAALKILKLLARKVSKRYQMQSVVGASMEEGYWLFFKCVLLLCDVSSSDRLVSNRSEANMPAFPLNSS